MAAIHVTWLGGPEVRALELTDEETILFWHRGLGLSDIALAHAMLEKAKRLGIGQRLRFT